MTDSKPKASRKVRVVAPGKVDGRPSSFNVEVFELIVAKIADGIPLRQICREPGMPSYRTFYDWIDADSKKPENLRLNLSSRFTRAREDGYDMIAEETLQIADDATNDWMEKHDNHGNSVGYVLNGEHVQRSKLRIETRLKLLAKWNPKKYGDRVDLNHGGQATNPIVALLGQINGTSLSPIELPVEDAEDEDGA